MQAIFFLFELFYYGRYIYLSNKFLFFLRLHFFICQRERENKQEDNRQREKRVFH